MVPRSSKKTAITVALSVLSALVISLLLIGKPGGADTIASATSAKSNPPGTPSPFPNVALPPMTPVPTNTALPPGVVPQKPIPDQATNSIPSWNPKPSDPYHVIIDAYPGPSPRIATQLSAAVISGTVKRIGAPRWTTPDGKRPENPHAANNTYTIYRPVSIAVDKYLKGEQTSAEILIQATGGTVGQDTVKWSGDLYTFREDEQVIIFLDRVTQTVDGSPLWQVSDHYTIANGVAADEIRHQSVQELFNDITTAQTNPGK